LLGTARFIVRIHEDMIVKVAVNEEAYIAIDKGGPKVTGMHLMTLLSSGGTYLSIVGLHGPRP